MEYVVEYSRLSDHNVNRTMNNTQNPNELPGHFVRVANFLAFDMAAKCNRDFLKHTPKLLELVIKTATAFVRHLESGDCYSEARDKCIDAFYDGVHEFNNKPYDPDLCYPKFIKDLPITKAIESITLHVIADFANNEEDLIPKLSQNLQQCSEFLASELNKNNDMNQALTLLKENPSSKIKSVEITAQQLSKQEIINKTEALLNRLHQLPILDKQTRSQTAKWMNLATQELEKTAARLSEHYVPSQDNAQGAFIFMAHLVDLIGDSIDKITRHLDRFSNYYALKDTHNPQFNRQQQARTIADLAVHINKLVVNRLPPDPCSHEEKLKINHRLGCYKPIFDGDAPPSLQLQNAMHSLK